MVAKSVKNTFILILLAAFGASAWVAPTFANGSCVCGTKKTLLVLADFPEYPHLSGQEEIANLFFGKVARYFSDVSYGKLSIAGNSTGWVRLPKLHDQYPNILAIAKDAFSAVSRSVNMSSFDEFVLILSFYPSPTAEFIQTNNSEFGSMTGFVVVEENRDWTTYARGFALMIGLWRYDVQLSGLGQLDLAAGGQGDMSAWSKLTLGWINESQVATEIVPFLSHVITLDPIETPATNALTLRVKLSEALGEYLVEVRQPLGYDRGYLQEYGAVLSYVPSANTSMRFVKVLQPGILGSATFLDPDADLSIVALNETSGRFRLLVADAEKGREAQIALYAMSRASEAIQAANAEDRIDGLSLAGKLLSDAGTLFAVGQFVQAYALGISAETSAIAATVPADYYEAIQLLAAAEAQKNTTLNIRSSESSKLVKQADQALDTATSAFNAKNFTQAKETAQAAIDLFNRAKSLDFTERVMEWLSNLSLIIPVVILAYALMYQLRSNLRGPIRTGKVAGDQTPSET